MAGGHRVAVAPGAAGDVTQNSLTTYHIQIYTNIMTTLNQQN